MSSKRFITIQFLFVILSACRSVVEVSAFISMAKRTYSNPHWKSVLQPLSMIADAAFAQHEEEKEKNKKRIRKNNNSDWIETSDGKFIPNIRRKIISKIRTKTSSPPSPLIQEVLTIEEYKDTVVEETEKIVAVRFYAPWCKACRAVAGSFKKLAKTYPNVKFVEVPVTKENSYLHQGLGVPSLPYGHIYHPDVGLVEELRLNKKDGQFKIFQNMLKSYVDGECKIQDEFSAVGKAGEESESNNGNHFFHDAGNDNEFQ